MATIRSGNFSFKEPPFQNGDMVEGGNYSQLRPGTDICKDVKGVTVKGGLFVNCIPPDDWDCRGGNWCQIEFCTHERPKLIKKGLTPCAADCKHRSSKKIERIVDEFEYRRKKIEAKDIANALEDSDLSIGKDVDADGVTVQTFKVREYDYTDRVVCKGARIRKGKGLL